MDDAPQQHHPANQQEQHQNLPPLQPMNNIQGIIQQAVDQAFAVRDRQQQNGVSTERLEKRRKLDSIELKSKGNKKQLQFCKELMETVENAFDNADIDVNKTKEALAEGKKLILRRIKLIRIADRETWDAVNEYESDELASDEEDEKHLNRAIRAANAKIEKRKKLRSARNRAGASYSNRGFGSDATKSREPFQRRAFSTPQSYPVSQNRACWSCGKIGHFAANCRSYNQGTDINNIRKNH